MKTITTTLSIFLVQLCISQVIDKQTIHGKIIVPSGNPEGVTIINLTNNNSTISDSEGVFFIEVKPKDELYFSAVNLEPHRKTITEEDLKPKILTIVMHIKTNQLNEIIIKKNSEINSFSAGIFRKKIKEPSKKERQLGIRNGGTDGIINAINGKTSLARKELVFEKKLDLLEKTKNLFEDVFYIEKLKIPNQYIKGFQYYCIDDPEFTAALKSNNKTMIEFLIIKLATDYNALISSK